MILWNFHSNLLKMINICLKMFWIHAENVKSICLELHVAVRQFDPKQSLTIYAVLFWKSIVSLYQCVVYVMECPLQHETTFHCKGRNTYWKNKPFNSRVPCGILWESCGIPACKIFLQKGPHSSEKVFMILKHNPEMCTAFL